MTSDQLTDRIRQFKAPLISHDELARVRITGHARPCQVDQ